MAIVIKHKESSEKYILLGSGFGMFKSQKPNWLFGNLVSDMQSGTVKTICACDKEGDIIWLNADEFQVVSVDGNTLSDLYQSTNLE